VATQLRTEGLTVTFGGNRALDGVNVNVSAGELVGLIGPNGAGKTTFIDAATGFVPAAGVVEVDGKRIDQLPPHRRVSQGVARTWQAVELFDDLTVLENLVVGQGRQGWLDTLVDVAGIRRPAVEDRALEALDVLGVAEVADAVPSSLAPGIRKAVGVARAVATGATLVLLDEPAAGLDEHESTLLGERLRRLVAQGIGVLLVDHDMHLVLSVSDRIDVLERGRLIASGDPDEIRCDPDVIAAYLGAETR
jgi:branched-chain amino acid transport system ATP-binding protein